MSNILVCDIEANGLLDTVTKIHCIVCMDQDKNMYSFHDNEEIDADGDILDGVALLAKAETLVFHNGIGYDIPVIKKLFPRFKPTGTIHDTFILSQMFYPNEMSSHGLEAWGEVFKVPKPKHEDWETFTEEMLHRCQMDTKITHRLWLNCKREMESHNWTPAIQLEYDVYQAYCDHMTYWFMDVEKLEKFIPHLEKIKEDLALKIQDLAPPKVIKHENPVTAFTQKGVLSARAVKYVEDPNQIVGDFCRFEYEPFNLNSSKQLSDWLISLGWRPEEWNYEKDKNGRDRRDERGELIKSSPKLSKSEFIGVPDQIAEVIGPYNKAKSRLGVLKGWRSSLYDVNKIKTFALTCACNTGRFKHGGVVNVPKAEEGVFFGKEMRSLFIAPEGYTLVGCDAAQLEARVEGHFAYRYDGGEYADFLLTADIHQFNADSWGLTRSQAKAPGYALAYQCSPKKIQQLLGCTEAQARLIHKRYWEDRPALRDLIDDLEKSVLSRNQATKKENGAVELKLSTRPWIRGIDGRKLYVRSAHSLKNTLIQNAGMTAVKIAFVKLAAWIKEQKLDARICMVYHDEFQIIVKEDLDTVQLVKELAEKAIEEAGKVLKMNISLKGEAKSGKNWAATH